MFLFLIKESASGHWQQELIPWISDARVNRIAHAFVLNGHCFIQTQGAADQRTGFNGLAVGGGGGISHALTGFGRRAVSDILVIMGVLQRHLTVVQTNDAVWRVQAAYLGLAGYAASRKKQNCTGNEKSFHGSLYMTVKRLSYRLMTTAMPGIASQTALSLCNERY
ncbi:hypothetical protein ENTCAN_06628 [Enterobacter cancerogenus ATCC 35316]|nr:hypothetical protein ENTCAN_06628 [Enterobacter cancerogenus ATCC 35316]